jgi:hypothetical protein
MSFEDIVQVLDETEVVAVITTRANGDPIATPIWSMDVDDVPYARWVNGAGAWWYRHVLSGRPVAFALRIAIAERDRDAALELPRDEAHSKIDDELERKYGANPCRSPGCWATMRARACFASLQLTEAGTAFRLRCLRRPRSTSGRAPYGETPTSNALPRPLQVA